MTNIDTKNKDKLNVAVWRWWDGNGTKKQPGIKTIVEKKQNELWKHRLMFKEGKDETIVNRVKGQFYLKCKKKWGEADYINENGNKRGRIWKSRMRASAVPLQAMLKDEHRSNTDICSVCSSGSREDQQHMILQCPAYDKERKIMMDELARRLSGDALV